MSHEIDVLTLAQLIQPGAASRTVQYVGAEHDAGASFFFVDNQPGQGVGLHWHPYSETWIVLEGAVTFRVGDASGHVVDAHVEEHVGETGMIITIPPERHHGFTNSGPGTLRMVCIHAGPRIIQVDLE